MSNSFSKMLETLKPHILPMMIWFTELTESISDFSKKYEYITKAIGISIPVFAGLALVLGGLKIAAGLLGTAFAILTSPITWIVIAIAAVGVGLYILEKKTGIVSVVFNKWWEIVTGYFSGIKETIKAVIDLFENGFTIDGLLNVFDKAAKTILTPFDKIFGTDLSELFKETISGWGNSLYDTLMEPINSVRNSTFGRLLGWSIEEKVSAKSIREGKSRTTSTDYASDSWIPKSIWSPLKQPEDPQKTGPTYQIHIGQYHSSSRNSVADWGELVTTAD